MRLAKDVIQEFAADRADHASRVDEVSSWSCCKAGDSNAQVISIEATQSGPRLRFF
jgi:hypothetical protein